MTHIKNKLIDALLAGKATPDQQAQAARFILDSLKFISNIERDTEEKIVELKARIAAAEQEQERREADREAREKAIAATINSILHPNRSS